MKLLHTSDWHLGKPLCGKRRTEEQAEFLDWLAGLILRESVDLLLVAGDVFDTGTPGSGVQRLYYRFLCSVAESGCSVVVVAGNHDSPSLLDAPSDILGYMNVFVLGVADPEREVVSIVDGDDEVIALVGAVPYLRERDIRSSSWSDDPMDRDRALALGIEEHYSRIFEAMEKKSESKPGVPRIAMGHLFAAGGKVKEDDGSRDLYVGGLGRVGVDLFPDWLDYVALGHLHGAQIVGGRERCRYSGSPMTLGFGESGSEKSVYLVDLDGPDFSCRAVPVPSRAEIVSLEGNRHVLSGALSDLVLAGRPCLVEAVLCEDVPFSSLREDLESIVEGSSVELLRVKDGTGINGNWSFDVSGGLESMTEEDVFLRRLEGVPLEQNVRDSYVAMFREVLQDILDQDGDETTS